MNDFNDDRQERSGAAIDVSASTGPGRLGRWFARSRTLLMRTDIAGRDAYPAPRSASVGALIEGQRFHFNE